MKVQTLTHLQTLFLLPHCRWNLKAKTLTHLEALFLRTSFPLDYTYSSISLQTIVCSSDSLILFDQTNVPTHFSSLNSTTLCKTMEMYGQGRYTISLKKKKKKEMYSLTSTDPPLYFSSSSKTSLSLSHFECYIRIFHIENNIQSYQWATHWKDCLLR